MEPAEVAAVLGAVLGPSGVFGWLRWRDKGHLSIVSKRIVLLEGKEKECRKEVEEIRTDFRRLQDELTRNERVRYDQLTELNKALLDKQNAIERSNALERQTWLLEREKMDALQKLQDIQNQRRPR